MTLCFGFFLLYILCFLLSFSAGLGMRTFLLDFTVRLDLYVSGGSARLFKAGGKNYLYFLGLLFGVVLS